MVYKYRARDDKGIAYCGTLVADHKDSVISELLARGWAIIGLQEIPDYDDNIREWHLLRPVRNVDIVFFTRQLSLMLAAGLPILNCLSSLEQQIDNVYLKKAVGNIISEIKSGSGLAAAISLHPIIFSPLYISVVKSGEMSGNLDAVLFRLGKHLEMEDAFQNKLKGASAYPIFTAALALLILSLVITLVMPKFALIFESSDVVLPWATRWLLGLGPSLKKAMPYLGVGAGVLVYVVVRVYKNIAGRRCLDSLIIQLPFVGRIEKQRITARFIGTMSLQLKSGLPVLEAIALAAETTANAAYQEAIKKAGQSIRAGGTITKSLKEAGLFTPMVTDMIAVGEQTGTLDTVMEHLSDYCNSELTAGLDSFAKLIEPALIVFVAVLVGGVVIAMLLPMINMVNLVGI